MNAELSKLNAQITTWDKRLTEIKSAIEKANAIRDGGTVSQSWECGSAIAAMMSGTLVIQLDSPEPRGRGSGQLPFSCMPMAWSSAQAAGMTNPD